ncbi:hypothetical protein ACJ72_02523 [Emergomyces africanus]|uniref:Nucleolar protein 12 n=1 Tax=Emergomyces africanus TaxID=1955775 RepID=A0A1B7P273_9EURO|nr:hypothetical protein ACJ72_02523 [Emergomyces africanus]
MGKKSKSQPKLAAAAVEAIANGPPASSAHGAVPTPSASLPFLGGSGDNAAAIDPMLAALFEKSAGPVKAPQFTSANLAATSENGRKVSRAEGDTKEVASSNEVQESEGSASDRSDEEMEDVDDEKSAPEKGRKRKRGGAEDLEESYMRRMAKEEAKEDEKQRVEKAKRRKDEDEESDNEDDINGPYPHESLSNDVDAAILDKSARTVFLSNVSTEAIKSKTAKKTLLKHLSSFFPSLPESATPHKIESIRFRSTAFSTKSMPKRAAYAKRELMDSTTRSTNAYVVYTTTAAARRAPQALNGSVVLDRHLRVDSVAHPAPVDYKRCIFVGNLGFVDEETPADETAEQQKKKKNTPPADVEEGLWRTFNEHTRASIAKPSSSSKPSKSTDSNTNDLGPVESVRVIRDPTTRVGKGVAYVQFRDENAVEAALLMDGKKFPPLLPRKLRVARAKRIMKKSGSGVMGITNQKRDTRSNNNNSSRNANKTALGERKGGPKQSSFQGRATGLLGKAGAWRVQNARLEADGEKGKKDNEKSGGSAPFVFEGFRARPDKGSGFKVKTKSRGAKSRAGKPKTRSTRRAAAFRAGGEKKKREA